MKKQTGFTLIELMIAIMIFAVIAVISYRIIASLVVTKEVVTESQNKWGTLAQAVSKLNLSWRRNMPIIIRNEDGNIAPALLGKPKLEKAYDSQLELTVSGYIGDSIYGSTPPKRIGFRFDKGTLYLVSWPVLNRVNSTTPNISALVDNLQTFTVSYLDSNQQWQPAWPINMTDPTLLPKAIKIFIKVNSGEEITLQWAGV